MANELNILILSCGTRNKIVRYFKNELRGRGKVIATDCSELAPALYEADKYYIVPKIDDENYLDTVLSICKSNNVKGVLSLIDPELSLLAKNKQKFLEIGAIPIVSEYDVVETCFDKFKMYQFLEKNKIKTPRSYIDKDLFYKDLYKGKINFPVFVKPVKGSASININKVTTKMELDLLFDRYDNLMIQEYMKGEEYGADAYIDIISNEVIAIFTKKKIKMRAGETDKSISIIDEKLFSIIIEFIKKANFQGVIDIDIFKVDGDYYISEVNPRFGGGYPHAFECNVSFPKLIINNLEGIKNNPNIGEYDENIIMLKYSELMIIN